MYSVSDLVANEKAKKVSVTLKSLDKEGRRRVLEGELFCVDNNTNPTTLVVGNIPWNENARRYDDKALWGIRVISMADVSSIDFPNLNQSTERWKKPSIDDYYGERRE